MGITPGYRNGQKSNSKFVHVTVTLNKLRRVPMLESKINTKLLLLLSGVENLKLGPFTLAKTKIQKTWGFVVLFTLPEKPISFEFLARKAHARKNLNLILMFW